MGDWQTDWSRGALQRIVVLLFALAGLADSAAGASFFRRRQALEILGCGEAEARAFVIGMVCGAAISPDELEFDDDATHLAVRLRALALVLCVMLARRVALLPGMDGFRGVIRPRAGLERPAGWTGRQFARPAPPYTS